LKVPHAVQIIAVCTTINVVVYRLRQLFIENVTYELGDRLGNLNRQPRDKQTETRADSYLSVRRKSQPNIYTIFP
jgi:hypothetical protein